jgi:hypothetical protein
MMRQAVRGLVALAAMIVLIETSSGQPGGVPDKITIRDKKDGSTKSYEGSLKFGPGGFQIVDANKKVLASVAPADVVKYVPGDLAGVERAFVLAQITLEDKKTKKDYETARAGYQDMQKKAATAPEPAKRYLEFKLAAMTTKVADDATDDEGWAAQADTAAKAWAGYLGEYKTGWEVWPATRSYTRILAELNKYDDIARTWAKTVKTPDLPSDLKLEAQMEEIDAQIRSKAFANASESAKSLAAAAAPGPAKDKLEIYAIAAEKAANSDYPAGIKAIQDKIAATKDPGVRGVGFSMTGELYMLAGKPREAMWDFLWVETVYNGDHDEAFKAMCRLVELFKAQGDDDRAKAYREKLRRARANF